MTTKYLVIILGGMGILASGLSTSQAQQNRPEFGPGLYPGVALSIFSDDNVLRNDRNKQSDSGVVIAPTLTHISLFGKHTLELHYFGAFAQYLDLSKENYNDNNVNAALNLDLSPQINFTVDGKYIWSHDARGASGTSLVQSKSPDRWKSRRLSGEFLYGRRTNRGQLGISLATQSREYTNNQQETRDRDRTTVKATFYYNFSVKTAALFEIDRADINYTRPSPVNLDSTEMLYALGMRWEATRQTTGKIRAGYVRKDLDDKSLDDFSGIYIAGNVVWEPRAMDRISITLSRSTHESNQITASYFVRSQFATTWEHQLMQLIAFGIDASVETDDYSDDRNDNLHHFGTFISYDLREWLDLDLRYTFSSRDSDLSGQRYDDNLLLFSLNMAAF